jgi:hypothetical protein
MLGVVAATPLSGLVGSGVRVIVAVPLSAFAGSGLGIVAAVPLSDLVVSGIGNFSCNTPLRRQRSMHTCKIA